MMMKCLFSSLFSTFKMLKREKNYIREGLGDHVSEHLHYFCRNHFIAGPFSHSH